MIPTCHMHTARGIQTYINIQGRAQQYEIVILNLILRRSDVLSRPTQMRVHENRSAFQRFKIFRKTCHPSSQTAIFRIILYRSPD